MTLLIVYKGPVLLPLHCIKRLYALYAFISGLEKIKDTFTHLLLIEFLIVFLILRRLC